MRLSQWLEDNCLSAEKICVQMNNFHYQLKKEKSMTFPVFKDSHESCTSTKLYATTRGNDGANTRIPFTPLNRRIHLALAPSGGEI